MEPHLLHSLLVFSAGLISGLIIMLIINKLKSGSMAPSNVKQEYQEYQDKVEEHFEETSKKFKEMTEQYQDLYKHLSVGATSLCRPDSVAAVLADESESQVKLEKKPEEEKVSEPVKKEQVEEKKVSEPEAEKPVEKKSSESVDKPS